VILKSFWIFLNPLLRPPAWQAQDQIDPSQNDLRITLQNFVFLSFWPVTKMEDA
jgi:hypothetical protein